MMQQDKSSPRGQSLFSVFRSVSASMFGVQSSKKHAEDFTKGSAKDYIIVGLVATVLFVLTIWGLVKLVVSVVAQPG
ncbi:hypothetical protein MNBD_GAMMA13-714 [hydrothermal vent metagenome]|uniref:DUF2970 domain-containing protein n=1 Tax=hydrothermal vent metagenome TaxID=652676 RepID=A0A3B0Y8R6_9ZZZZ